MKTRTLIWFGLSIISAIVALIIFFNWLDYRALLFLVFGVVAVLLFRQGIAETSKKKQ